MPCLAHSALVCDVVLRSRTPACAVPVQTDTELSQMSHYLEHSADSDWSRGASGRSTSAPQLPRGRPVPMPQIVESADEHMLEQQLNEQQLKQKGKQQQQQRRRPHQHHQQQQQAGAQAAPQQQDQPKCNIQAQADHQQQQQQRQAHLQGAVLVVPPPPPDPDALACPGSSTPAAASYAWPDAAAAAARVSKQVPPAVGNGTQSAAPQQR